MNNLKQLRLQHGLSQQKLADLLNISQQSIYKYENNLAEPDIHTLKQLSALFNTSIDYIVGNTENPRRIDFMTEQALTPDELEHLKLYRKLPAHRQALINALLRDYNFTK